MARKEIDEVLIHQLEDVAGGVEGSEGEVSLSPDLTNVYKDLGGDLDACTDLGGGAVMVSCVDLCRVVFGSPSVTEEKKSSNRSQKRKEGTK